MSNETFLQLPTVTSALLTDVVPVVQGGALGVTAQETWHQVNDLFLDTNTLTYAGNPNSNLAGTQGQICLDSLGTNVYICKTSGTSSTAVWVLLNQALPNPLSPSGGGTGTSTAFTPGSIVFAESGGNYTQDNTNLFWDDTNDRLGVGTNTPTQKIQVAVNSNSLEGMLVGNASSGGNAISAYIATNDVGNFILFGASSSGLTIAPFPDSAFIAAPGLTGGIVLVAQAGDIRLLPTGNVGIKNSAPTTALDVTGTVTATAFVGDISGCTGFPVTGILPPANGGTGTSVVFTPGSVVFAGGSGAYSESNSNLFYDQVNGRFSVGTNSPTDRFNVHANENIITTAAITNSLVGTGAGAQFEAVNSSGHTLDVGVTSTTFNIIPYPDTAFISSTDATGGMIFTTNMGDISLLPTGNVNIQGCTDGSSAAITDVGAIISSIVLVGSAVSLTTGTPANVTSMILTAGDWDIYGSVSISVNGTTTISSFTSAINTVSATIPLGGVLGKSFQNLNLTFTTGSPITLDAGNCNLSVSSNTTVYLIALVDFAVSNADAYGSIYARRRR